MATPQELQAALAQERWRQQAMAAMQQNPMAYLAYTHQVPGQGFQLNPMPVQQKPQAKPKAKAPRPAPAKPVSRGQAMGAFDRLMQGAREAVAAPPVAALPQVQMPRTGPAPVTYSIDQHY